MPYTPPPDYSHHQQAQADEIKRAQDAQKQWANAEKLRLEVRAKQARRDREASQRVQRDRTTQRY